MSLIRQLWIAIAVVAIIALSGSLAVSTLSVRDHLEQQLGVKNLDNASSLALSITQMDKDPVTVELLVAAQFDAGHYRLIRLLDPEGRTIVEKAYDGPPSRVPEWFQALVPIEAPAGIAQVQDGWKQFGTLTLASHSRYAYEALWDETLRQLAWFAACALLTGVAGTLILNHITRPLARVVEQAEAIGGRRFVTTAEPRTSEFRSVVRAMNALSARVRLMLADESQRLEALRRQVQHDELTGLLNRQQFMKRLDAVLAREDASASGALLIARLPDLARLNQRLGRDGTNRLLRSLADALARFAMSRDGFTAGRVNASDLSLIAPGASDPAAIALECSAALVRALDAHPGSEQVRLPAGATGYTAGEPRAQVLSRLDGALALAEQAGDRAVHVAGTEDPAPLHTELGGWREEITRSLEANGVRLGRYPVLDARGERIHLEAPMRLLLGGDWRSAGFFMPWAARLGLLPALDAAVIRAALQAIMQDGVALGVNVSGESIANARFRDEVRHALQASPQAAGRLWIDVPEYAIQRFGADFRALCGALRPLGCRLGIEHVGPHFDQLDRLHELGLDYLKIDASLVRGIDSDAGNQALLRSLCLLGHSIGLSAIAEGVTTEAERTTLFLLGADGVTGAGVQSG